MDWLQEKTVGLVVGSEGNGLTPAVRNSVEIGEISCETGKVAVSAVHVPMQAGVESLNAAVCGSVILFEFLRQRDCGDSDNGR